MATKAGMEGALRAIEQFRQDLGQIAADELDAVKLEREVQELVNAVGLEMMKDVLVRADEAAPEVLINGARWGNRRAVKATYATVFGEIELERGVYQRSGRGPIAVPMELRLRIVEGRYTPVLARIMTRAVGLMPAADAEGMLQEVGTAMVSVSTLHRVPRAMSARHEQHRMQIESAVRERDVVPPSAAVVQAALDGVMVPQDGEHAKPRGRKKTDSEPTDPPRHELRYGPSERAYPADSDGENGRAWHEASVGTLAFWDAEGNHLKTIYIAQMPEVKKATLVERLKSELDSVVARRPDLDVCFASDGALAQWDALEGIESSLPRPANGTRTFLVDFYHLAGYVADAANAVAGAGTDEAESLRHFWCDTLRVFEDGTARVLRMMRYRRDQMTTQAKRDEIDTSIEFIANQARHGRTNYATAIARNHPIATGVTEAAAKTVVNVRMKRAGARYSQQGGQTILLFRAAILSERHHLLSDELEATYGATLKHAA